MSDLDIQGGEILKPETAEIIKELEAEGHSIEGKEPKEEPKPEAQVADPEPEKVEDQPETEEKPKVERKVQAVPVHKYNEERHKRQEAEKRAADLEAQLQKPTPVEVSGDVKDVAAQFAEKHGLDADLVADLLDTATKITAKNTTGLSEQELADLRRVKDTLDKQEENLAFENDFNKVAKQLEDEGLNVTGHKDQIKQLAYTEGYTSTSLRAIALEYAHDNGLLSKGRKTLESKQAGRVIESEAIDFDSLSEEQAKALPDDQWEKFVDHQIKKQQRAQGITV